MYVHELSASDTEKHGSAQSTQTYVQSSLTRLTLSLVNLVDSRFPSPYGVCNLNPIAESTCKTNSVGLVRLVPLLFTRSTDEIVAVMFVPL